MAAEMAEAKQHVCTLASGWRVTIPSALRRARGWHEGFHLIAKAAESELLLATPDASGYFDRLPGNRAPVPCYLGFGGKIVVPAALRPALAWEVGERLAVSGAGPALAVVPCCHKGRCRSCGSIQKVKEIIPGLNLCSDCWQDYISAKRHP